MVLLRCEPEVILQNFLENQVITVCDIIVITVKLGKLMVNSYQKCTFNIGGKIMVCYHGFKKYPLPKENKYFTLCRGEFIKKIHTYIFILHLIHLHKGKSCNSIVIFHPFKFDSPPYKVTVCFTPLTFLMIF